ncbi:MAG: transposase [Solirubrobacterales bacterium]|nr:transposase [Solirubrobacterales bacterium]
MSVYEQLLRGPVESGQYTSIDYTQELTDHGVVASVGSVGDAYDNAMAESFVDSFKTELLADRVFQSRSQLELAVVEYIAWFNNDRLHESLGDIPPVEFEALRAVDVGADPGDRSSTAPPPKPADALSGPRSSAPAPDAPAIPTPSGSNGDRPPGSARPTDSLRQAASTYADR